MVLPYASTLGICLRSVPVVPNRRVQPTAFWGFKVRFCPAPEPTHQLAVWLDVLSVLAR